VTTLRCVLSAVAAIFVALLGPGLVSALWGINNSKATGLAAVVGGFLESLFSPLFWILAVSFFALFFAASRLSSKPLRIFLDGYLLHSPNPYRLWFRIGFDSGVKDPSQGNRLDDQRLLH